MNTNNRNRGRAASARGFMALFAVPAMGLGLLATPAEAAPFAYVTNGASAGTVSVIDTATNPPTVVATVPVGSFAGGVAVAPDGKHAYVGNGSGISVIDTVTNTVVATVPVAGGVGGIAVTPDDKHVYVTNGGSNTVSVIDTVTNTVAATVPVGNSPFGVAITPDGKHAYVTNSSGFTGDGTVSVIRTATNTVVATIQLQSGITPRAKSQLGRRHAGWQTRLCLEFRMRLRRHKLGDRHGQQHRDCHAGPGEVPPERSRLPRTGNSPMSRTKRRLATFSWSPRRPTRWWPRSRS